MDQGHPTVGWVVKMGAEIKIQKDPAVMAHGWLSLYASLGSCAVADPGSVANPPQQPAGTALWAAPRHKTFTKRLWELLRVETPGTVGGKIFTHISKIPHSRATLTAN